MKLQALLLLLLLPYFLAVNKLENINKTNKGLPVGSKIKIELVWWCDGIVCENGNTTTTNELKRWLSLSLWESYDVDIENYVISCSKCTSENPPLAPIDAAFTIYVNQEPGDYVYFKQGSMENFLSNSHDSYLITNVKKCTFPELAYYICKILNIPEIVGDPFPPNIRNPNMTYQWVIPSFLTNSIFGFSEEPPLPFHAVNISLPIYATDKECTDVGCFSRNMIRIPLYGIMADVAEDYTLYIEYRSMSTPISFGNSGIRAWGFSKAENAANFFNFKIDGISTIAASMIPFDFTWRCSQCVEGTIIIHATPLIHQTLINVTYSYNAVGYPEIPFLASKTYSISPGLASHANCYKNSSFLYTCFFDPNKAQPIIPIISSADVYSIRSYTNTHATSNQLAIIGPVNTTLYYGPSLTYSSIMHVNFIPVSFGDFASSKYSTDSDITFFIGNQIFSRNHHMNYLYFTIETEKDDYLQIESGHTVLERTVPALPGMNQITYGFFSKLQFMMNVTATHRDYKGAIKSMSTVAISSVQTAKSVNIGPLANGTMRMSAPCLDDKQTIYESRFIQTDLPPYTAYRTNFKLYPNSYMLIDLELNQLLEIKIFIDHSAGRSSFFFGSLTSFDTTYASLKIDCNDFYQHFDEFIVYSISAGSKISIYGVRLVSNLLPIVWPDSLPNAIKVPTNISYGVTTVELVPHLMFEWQCHEFEMAFFDTTIHITNSSVIWYAIPDSTGISKVNNYYTDYTHCPPGYYPVINENLVSVCESCLEGCVCGKGLLTPCSSVGSFSRSANDTDCSTECPAGTYPGITAKGYHACYLCPVGFACPGKGIVPVKCEDNYFTSSKGQTECQICNGTVIKDGTLQISCSCNRGYYLIGSKCEMCPLGYACNGIGSLPCLNNTYSDSRGLAECKVCGQGFIVESMNSIGTGCKKCGIRYACDGYRSMRCQIFYKSHNGECVVDTPFITLIVTTFIIIFCSFIAVIYVVSWKYSRYLKDPHYRVYSEI